MCVFKNKQLNCFQSCFGILSRLYQWRGWNVLSRFKCLGGQHNAVSREARCPRPTCWGA